MGTIIKRKKGEDEDEMLTEEPTQEATVEAMDVGAARKERPPHFDIARGVKRGSRASGGSLGRGSARHRGGAKKPLKSIYG